MQVYHHEQSLARLYELAMQSAAPQLQPQVSRSPWWERWQRHRQVEKLDKAVGKYLRERLPQDIEAEEQGTIVRELLTAITANDTYQGVREPQEASFDLLRRMAHHCEPAIAIINTRVRQAGAYGDLPDVRHGYVRKPGFRIRMTLPEEEATPKDRKRIAQLEQFMLNGGFCDPPVDERPDGWQPGLVNFIQQIIRDSLTYDWVAIRRWRASPKVDGAGKYPIVSFAAVDASRIRRKRRRPVKVEDGVIRSEDWDSERANTKEEIVYVKMSSPNDGGTVVEEYSAREMACVVRNPRTDEEANGYGYSELEQCVHAVTAWIWSRDYNMSRFRNDALPRGLLAVLGQLDRQQFEMFKIDWMSMLKGLGKRWNVPILRGLPQAGSSVNWIPFDMNSRDMEYHQFLFSVSLWMHAIFGIHPEETGFQALSPFRPPLSEASPETKLKYSQDSSFTPLLKWLQDLINREILWVLVPDRRYMLEFVGVGDMDQMQDVEFRGALLQTGLTTPREQWNELDKPLPEPIKDHPAWDLPMPFAEGVQLILTLQQAEMQMQQAQQQQQMAQEQAVQQMGAQQGMAMGQGGPSGPGGGPPGMPGQGGGGPPMPGGGDGGEAPPGVTPGQGLPVRQMPPGVEKSLTYYGRKKQEREAARTLLLLTRQQHKEKWND